MNDQQDRNPGTRPILNARAAEMAGKVLTLSTMLWFVAITAGQAVFAAYIALFYGGATVRGDLHAWNEVIPGRVVDGDAVGFSAIAAHLVLAFVVTVIGPFQLVPGLRARLPKLHHWMGRIYLAAGYAISLGGLYLIWGHRDADDTLLGSAPLTLNALLIITFATMALKNAMGRRIDLHRQWALRLFMAMSGVWFLRVLIMVWVVTLGADGLGARLEGPVGTFLKFACYAFPLVALELYFAARRAALPLLRWLMAAVIFGLTALMGTGIVMATMALWLPHM